MIRSRSLVALTVVLALAACAAKEPAPVVYRGGEAAPVFAAADARGAASAPRAGTPADTPEGDAPPRRIVRGESIVVPSGGTLYGIAEEHRVSLRALIDANALEPPFRLSAGQTLTLPPPNTYVVQPGDTLFAIARRHRVQPRSLALLNDMREPYAIQPGDEIELPGSARDWEAGARPLASADAVTQAPLDGPDVADARTAREAPAPEARESGRRAAPAAPAGPPGRFVWPAEGPVIDDFGPKAAGRRNDGLNIAAQEGDPVRAAADGLVVYAGDELAGYGHLILVKHDDGWVSAYAHNRAILVAEDQRVRQGQAIAEVGASGAVERPQLHFELRRNGRPVDPESALPRRTG